VPFESVYVLASSIARFGVSERENAGEGGGSGADRPGEGGGSGVVQAEAGGGGGAEGVLAAV